MIDFRYHLISLIAVFLALGLGILMGSVVLSEKYVDRLEHRVEDIGQRLDDKREEVALLNDRVAALQDFSLEAEPRLIGDALAGQEVVVFELDGTDEALVRGLRDAIEEAGGTLVSTVRFTERLELADQAERDELALLLGSASGEAAELRTEMAETLGVRAAGAAAARVDAAQGSPSGQRLKALTDGLAESEFISIESTDEVPVPPGASFIVAGGSRDQVNEDSASLTVNLGTSLASREAAVMVVEPSDSAWGLVDAVRGDGDAGGIVSTADHAETVAGRVAVVLGLEMAIDGVGGHYGTRDGATAIVPPPTPGG